MKGNRDPDAVDHDTEYDLGDRVWPHDTLLLAALVVVISAWHLRTLSQWPLPFVDEAWRGNRVAALIETGYPFGTMDRGVFDRFDRYWRFPPFLEIWLSSLPVRALGMSLMSMRLTSWVAGVVCLGAVVVVARTVGGSLAAVLTCLITGLSLPFMVSSHLARQDIMVAATGYGALCIYWVTRSERTRSVSLLLGLLSVVAFEIHPNGSVFAATLALLYLLDRKAAGAPGTSRTFFLGMAMGVLLYAAYHIVPNPETYATITRIGYGSTHTPPILTGKPQLVLGGFRDTVVALLSHGGTSGIAGLLSAVAAATMLRHPPKSWLAISLVILCMVSLLIRSKRYYYTILVTPSLDVLTGTTLASLAYRTRAALTQKAYLLGARSAAVVLLLCILLALDPARFQPRATACALADYNATVDAVSAVVEAHSSVMGNSLYWFQLQSSDYIAWEQLVYYLRSQTNASVKDALMALGPDYVIVDGHMRRYIVDRRDTQDSDPYAQHLTILRSDFEDAMRGGYVEIASIQSETSGTIQIYRRAAPSTTP